jgi:peptidyl-dipeptidase Dcp
MVFVFGLSSNNFVCLYLLVYLWAEVLDADVYAAFKATGNVFDPDMAERVRKYVYSAGNTEAPDELFRKFRGRDPDIKYMLEKKSLVSQN